MTLFVDITKRAGDFELCVKFETFSEVFALLGASGCGKSMTLKCIAGIETPDAGRIVLDDKVLFDSELRINLKPQDRHVGYMFQDYALFPNMTVRQNILVALKCSDNDMDVFEYITKYHLEGLENHYPEQLSGGQKQRTAMARMMASKPDIILLDEPFAAMDSFLKSRMIQEMKRELAQINVPTVFVSHDRDEVFELSSTICVLNDGKSQMQLGRKEFFDNPGTITAAVLSGCKNISMVEKVDETHVLVLDWGVIIPVPDEIDVHAVGIRAHDFQVERADIEFEVTVLRIQEEMFEWDIYCQSKGNGEILWKISKKAMPQAGVDRVPDRLYVKSEHILMLV